MNEQIFWETIESSWADSPELYKLRSKALETNDGDFLEELSSEVEVKILENYKARLSQFDKENFTEFIHILEEKLFKIDREEIQQYTDGSDDGFLYCRCFIVAMGEQYYNSVDKNPSKATMDVEAETFGFSAYSVYQEKFGEEFDRNSIYCIESCSNKDGWKS